MTASPEEHLVSAAPCDKPCSLRLCFCALQSVHVFPAVLPVSVWLLEMCGTVVHDACFSLLADNLGTPLEERVHNRSRHSAYMRMVATACQCLSANTCCLGTSHNTYVEVVSQWMQTGQAWMLTTLVAAAPLASHTSRFPSCCYRYVQLYDKLYVRLLRFQHVLLLCHLLGLVHVPECCDAYTQVPLALGLQYPHCNHHHQARLSPINQPLHCASIAWLSCYTTFGCS